MTEEASLRALKIVEGVEPQGDFGFGRNAFIPHRLTTPGISPLHLTVIQHHPGMMAEQPIEAEELNLTHVAT